MGEGWYGYGLRGAAFAGVHGRCFKIGRACVALVMYCIKSPKCALGLTKQRKYNSRQPTI